MFWFKNVIFSVSRFLGAKTDKFYQKTFFGIWTMWKKCLHMKIFHLFCITDCRLLKVSLRWLACIIALIFSCEDAKYLSWNASTLERVWKNKPIHEKEEGNGKSFRPVILVACALYNWNYTVEQDRSFPNIYHLARIF